MRHFLHKLKGTLALLLCFFMARMFGEYRHSGWDGAIHYARYSWHGYDWIIPTSPVECPHDTPRQS